MEFSSIKKILKQNGACNDVDRVSNYEELANVFFSARGAEYVINKRFPDYNLFKEYKDDVRPYGIYVDENDVDFSKGYNFCLVGKTENKAVLTGTKSVYKIYLIHGAKVRIEAKGYAVVKVVKLTDDCDYELHNDSKVVML